MKILLIGKTGQLGGDLLRNNICHEIYAPSREILDIERSETVETQIKDFCPDMVINTAAFHNVPACEKEFDKAFRINCIAVKRIADLCRERDARFITFSTDYVFNGEKKTPYLETDAPAPLQLYGISRLAGEYYALATAPDQTIIIRTCGLYGVSGARSKGGNFVDNRISDSRSMKILEISSEQIVSPTSTFDLSLAIYKLIEHPGLKSGIYHLVNEGEVSWYEFTKAIFEMMKINIEVRPVDRGGFSGNFKRPLYSVLANKRAKEMGIVLPHWRDGLKRYLGKNF
jgi:dTDP-4-dehydrorhamnose reductase